MIFSILRNLCASSTFKGLLLLLTVLSLVLMSFHLTLYSLEEDFLSNFHRSGDVEQELNIDVILMEFQEAIAQSRGGLPSVYRPHSGLPVLGYSEIIDFALLRIYDCGHAVALFNRLARYHGVDCGPITSLGSGGSHVISNCEIEGNVVFVDPFFNFIYRHADGTFATQGEILSNWEHFVHESENAGVRNYPIEGWQVRNPKFLLNRFVDFVAEQGLEALELFSFRRIVISTHLFLGIVSGFVGFLSLLFLRLKS